MNLWGIALQRQCGFGPGDEITLHVYAHGMGCLVSRYLIELAGGHQFVDRLVMAGPPNQGTTLATLSRGFVYIANTLINHYSAIRPISVFRRLSRLQRCFEDDLRPEYSNDEEAFTDDHMPYSRRPLALL